MSALVVAAITGTVTGFLGAIPPGPASLAVAQHASVGRARGAFGVAFGAASVDVCLTAAIALGAGPLLVRWTEPPMVRLFLAVAYVGLGVMLLVETALRRRKHERAAPERTADGYLSGVLRGVTNPSLVANWTLVVAGLTAAGVLPPGRACGVAFALGVGAGVTAWFATLAHVVLRARGARLEPWLRGAGALTGLLLVVGGGLSLLPR